MLSTAPGAMVSVVKSGPGALVTCECRHAAHSGGGGGPGAPRQEQEAPGQGSSAPCC